MRRLVDDLVAKGLSAGSVHRVVRTLSVALNAAVAERSILDNATVGVRLPRVELTPVRPLTHDDAVDILAAVDGHWLELPVRVLLGSGMRLGEKEAMPPTTPVARTMPAWASAHCWDS